MRKILFWRKMFYYSNAVLRILAVECRQFIAAIANSYNITIYDIVHCNNFMLRNMFWQKFGRSGKLLVWDVTVVSTAAKSSVAAAARGRGEVAEMAATGKCQKYSELPMAYLFFPILVETLSPMNDSAYEFFEIIGRKITDASGYSREVSFLFQRLSVIIQRFNEALFRDTFTLHDDPDL